MGLTPTEWFGIGGGSGPSILQLLAKPFLLFPAIAASGILAYLYIFPILAKILALPGREKGRAFASEDLLNELSQAPRRAQGWRRFLKDPPAFAKAGNLSFIGGMILFVPNLLLLPFTVFLVAESSLWPRFNWLGCCLSIAFFLFHLFFRHVGASPWVEEGSAADFRQKTQKALQGLRQGLQRIEREFPDLTSLIRESQSLLQANGERAQPLSEDQALRVYYQKELLGLTFKIQKSLQKLAQRGRRVSLAEPARQAVQGLKETATWQETRNQCIRLQTFAFELETMAWGAAA